jgi:hypothetical protein
MHPNNEGPGAGLRRSVEAAAPSFGVELTLIRDVQIERALDGFARDSFARKSNSGLIVLPGIYTGVYRYAILALAARYRWPAVYPFREWVVSVPRVPGAAPGACFAGPHSPRPPPLAPPAPQRIALLPEITAELAFVVEPELAGDVDDAGRLVTSTTCVYPGGFLSAAWLMKRVWLMAFILYR